MLEAQIGFDEDDMLAKPLLETMGGFDDVHLWSATIELGRSNVKGRSGGAPLLPNLILVRVIVSVDVDEFLEIFGQVVHRMDRVRRASWNAGPAIDASCGIDIELGHGIHPGFIFLGVNAIGWADIDAKEILDAGIGNYVGHGLRSERIIRITLKLFLI